LQVDFDATDGSVAGLADDRTGLDIAGGTSTVRWTVGGTERRFPPTARVEYEGAFEYGASLSVDDSSVTTTGDAVVVDLTCRSSEWDLHHEYRIEQGTTRIEHALTLVYRGTEPEVRVRDVSVNLEFAGFAPDATVTAPGAPMVPATPLDRLGTDEAVDWEPLRFDTGVVCVEDPVAGGGLGAWIYSWDHPTSVHFSGGAGELALAYDLGPAARLGPGEAVSFAHVCLQPYEGGVDDQLDAIGAWWSTVGLTAPDDRPAWAETPAIYECHVGTATFRDEFDYAPYPTVEALLEDLPRIAELGFDVIQLMPKQPFPSYVYHEYDDVSTYWGDRAALEELLDAAHSRGIRVILDFVLHGVHDRDVTDRTVASIAEHDLTDEETLGVAQWVLDYAPSWEGRLPERHPLVETHPDWFMRTDDGQVAHRYTHAFDLANPDLQSYLIEAFRWLLDDLGVDGFRLDAPFWNGFPNWDEDLPYPASHAMVGAVTLFRRARAALRPEFPDALFYVEAIRPAFRESADVNYNYDQMWLLEAVVGGDETRFGRQLPGDVTAAEMATWLDQRRRTLPDGSRAVHHVDSHDTFWWPEPGAKWYGERYDPAAAEAMIAAFGLLDGGYMHYVGAEEGHEDHLRRVLQLRSELPELTDGSCEYRAVTTDDPDLFVVFRSAPGTDQHSVVAVNTADAATDTVVSLPTDRLAADRYTVYDALDATFVRTDPTGESGSRIHGADALADLAVSFDAYQPRLLVVRAVED
jgi:hypothetical protein